MIDEQYSKLVTAYLDGSITPGQEEQLHQLLNRGEIQMEELEELERIYASMEHLPVPEPAEKVRNRFYQMLAEEQNRTTDSVPEKVKAFLASFQIRKMAAALGIFLAGMLIGNWQTPFQDYRHQLDQLSTEVSQMREVMMMSLLDNDSATERLKAVNISTEVKSADSRITEALLKTLNNDPNVNVRLAAIEALLHHASNPLAREGLVNAITVQKSPIVQAALADAMLILQEKKSVEEFRKLLDRNGLDHNVRNKLQTTIAALS